MPELPEVEVVRQGIERWVAGRTIESATVLHPRAARRHIEGPSDLAARLTGRLVSGACRRGKYLWLPVGDDEALLAHLGMSGQLIVGEPEKPYEKHLRARFTFTDGGLDLRFIDQRTFGHLMLTGITDDGVPEPIAHIAPDPLEKAFDEEEFLRSLRRPSRR